MAAAVSATALAASTLLYAKYKPTPPPTKRIEKIMDPYKNLVAKTTQKPPETGVTIELENLEDLAKIAEILARPILHTTENDEHAFYINTKYLYKIKSELKEKHIKHQNLV
ncbi:MAG: DUF5305 family protein [Candidatus Bathyarchaeia archaeon]